MSEEALKMQAKRGAAGQDLWRRCSQIHFTAHSTPINSLYFLISLLVVLLYRYSRLPSTLVIPLRGWQISCPFSFLIQITESKITNDSKMVQSFLQSFLVFFF